MSRLLLNNAQRVERQKQSMHAPRIWSKCCIKRKMSTYFKDKDKGSPTLDSSIWIPELILLLSSRPGGDESHTAELSGRLPSLSAILPAAEYHHQYCLVTETR